MLSAECYSGLLKVDDDAVDLSILRKVLLCAVLIVVFNQRTCFCLGSRYVCVCVCVSAPRAIKAIYVK